jgi:hypothetical protein
LYQHLDLLAAARVIGIGEFEQFSGTAASASKRIHSTPNSLFSWLTTKTFRCFKWVSLGFASGSGNSDVMVPAHCFLLSVELAQILSYRYRI